MPAPNPDSRAVTVVLVAHGSRSASANQAHVDLAAALQARSGLTVVGAFMELAQPVIGEAIRQAADAGATTVAVLPYFLHPGRHLQADIPRLVAEAADSRPMAEVRLLDPFGTDPGIVDLLALQVATALEPRPRSAAEGRP